MAKEKYNDYPLNEIAPVVDDLIDMGCQVYQKWSCKHCGARQTMPDANIFYLKGICEECGKETQINACNYAVVAPGDAAIKYMDYLAEKNK